MIPVRSQVEDMRFPLDGGVWLYAACLTVDHSVVFGPIPQTRFFYNVSRVPLSNVRSLFPAYAESNIYIVICR